MFVLDSEGLAYGKCCVADRFVTRRLLNWGDRADAEREAEAKRSQPGVLTMDSRADADAAAAEAKRREAGGMPGPNVSLAARPDVMEQVRKWGIVCSKLEM